MKQFTFFLSSAALRRATVKADDPAWSAAHAPSELRPFQVQTYTEGGKGPPLMDANTGIVFQLPGDCQFDAGCYLGVTGTTDDAHPNVGVAHRI